MKRYLLAAAIGAIAAGPVAWADDAYHAESMAGAGMPGMMSTMSDSDTAAQTMQENVKRMQSQVDAIRGAKDPDERNRLLAEHFRAMRENMALGQAMMHGGAGMMGAGMGMMDGTEYAGTLDQCVKLMGGLPAGAPRMGARMDQMEKRMDMMQMMMGQMAHWGPARSVEAQKEAVK